MGSFLIGASLSKPHTSKSSGTSVAFCHATDGPPKTVPPGPFMAAAAGPLGPFVALQVVPPDQLWRHGWSSFAMVGPPSGP